MQQDWLETGKKPSRADLEAIRKQEEQQRLIKRLQMPINPTCKISQPLSGPVKRKGTLRNGKKLGPLTISGFLTGTGLLIVLMFMLRRIM
ncbi:hypothetical protein KSF73_10005 [Burkholderiaceae bacterium DAT-1]|nr:hypothetical protein [Burkholderiaceae bacterium DAT-1]